MDDSSLSFFNKSVTVLFLLVDFQPCVIGIRFKFAQQKQSSYTFIEKTERVMETEKKIKVSSVKIWPILNPVYIFGL
jgi:hypothetical protein